MVILKQIALNREAGHTPGYKVVVTDILTGKKYTYLSILSACRYLNITPTYLHKCNGFVINNIYHIFIDYEFIPNTAKITRTANSELSKEWSLGNLKTV